MRKRGARTSKLERSRTATEKPQICRAACGQMRSNQKRRQRSRRRWRRVALTVEERAAKLWSERRRATHRRYLCLAPATLRVRRLRDVSALEAGCGVWCVSWQRSRVLRSGEFAFAAPTAATCCCFAFNWTCNVRLQLIASTGSALGPKNSSAAAGADAASAARVPQFSFIVDWALAYH